MTDMVHLENITIVLHRPRFSENIGAVARAMRNLGFDRLIVVDPADFDLIRIEKMATHAAADIVKTIEIHNNLRKALAPFHYVVGSTARTGKQRRVSCVPSFGCRG